MRRGLYGIKTRLSQSRVLCRVLGKSRLFGFVLYGNLLKSCLLFFAFFLLFRKLGSNKNKKTRVSKSTTSHLDFAKWSSLKLEFGAKLEFLPPYKMNFFKTR